MAPTIKFSSFGIPYLVEFSNVKFRGDSPTRLHSPFALCGNRQSISSLPTASSATLQPQEIGLYVQSVFGGHARSQKLSEAQLMHMKRRIAKAVVAAGMDAAPSSAADTMMAYGRAKRGSTRAEPLSVDGSGLTAHGSLYSGTYGQVISALKTVGLVTTPCKESAVASGATRLGALFVAKHTEEGAVEFSKLTLWA